MIWAFIEALVPVFLLGTLGFLLTRHTHYLDNPALTDLVTQVGAPALLLHSVLTMNTGLGDMALLLGCTAVLLVTMAGVNFLVLKLTGTPTQFHWPALTNPNTGNLGIPVCFALFGPEAIAPAAVISSVVQISHFTLGIGSMSGQLALHKLIRNAPVIALLTGACLLALNIQLPASVMNSLDMLGSITIPIMLLLLGQSIARMKLEPGLLARPLLLALWRPLSGVVVALSLLPLLPLGE
ncbi:MAG: AEC family transporter, partial [Oceanobacter sp.]